TLTAGPAALRSAGRRFALPSQEGGFVESQQLAWDWLPPGLLLSGMLRALFRFQQSAWLCGRFRVRCSGLRVLVLRLWLWPGVGWLLWRVRHDSSLVSRYVGISDLRISWGTAVAFGSTLDCEA